MSDNYDDIKFAIVIATYYRKNGLTRKYLKKSLKSILNQTHKNWTLIVVGDKYEKENELINLLNKFKSETNNDIIYIDNQEVERDNIKNKSKLWHCAGANSMNKGLKYARDNLYKYYVHLDDDDVWEPNHLEEMAKIYAKYPNCIFTNTKSKFINETYLPDNNISEIYENNMLPTSENMVHSSISFRLDIGNFMYDTDLINGIKSPSDAMMLDKIKKFLTLNTEYISIYIPKVTCSHIEEGLSKNETNKKENRILLTDIVFPNKYAKWRLVEINSFMEEFDTDILVINKIDRYSIDRDTNIKFDFDYENLSKQFNLENYNILIFDPKYNNINRYNKNFDGRLFNNKINASYLFRKKKFDKEEFDIEDYDKVYHIFLMNYYDFNKILNFDNSKQYIHLYPGGGMIDNNSIIGLNQDVKLISTQYFITDFIKNLNLSNEILENYGAPYFYSNENIRIKSQYKNNNVLTVCFTSLGNIYEKGADKYVLLAQMFKELYPHLNINFISIGVCPDSPYIKKYKTLDQDQLLDFYYNNVDLIINLDSGIALNGFPLGTEAVSQGCLLLTTDIHNSNVKNNFYLDNFIIIDRNNIYEIVEKIKYLYENEDILLEKAVKLQINIYNLFNYENHMKKILDFIR